MLMMRLIVLTYIIQRQAHISKRIIRFHRHVLLRMYLQGKRYKKTMMFILLKFEMQTQASGLTNLSSRQNKKRLELIAKNFNIPTIYPPLFCLYQLNKQFVSNQVINESMNFFGCSVCQTSLPPLQRKEKVRHVLVGFIDFCESKHRFNKCIVKLQLNCKLDCKLDYILTEFIKMLGLAPVLRKQ